MAFARAGCSVDLIDLSAERAEMVNQARMPFNEEGAQQLLPRLIRSGLLRATCDRSAVEKAVAVIVTIGTPAGAALDLSGVHQLLTQLRNGQLLVLRSTVPVGTTDRLAQELSRLGRDGIDLAYCPERIVQGKSLEELESLPQLIAGVTPRAADRAAKLFEQIATKLLFLQPVEAELAKLFCNSYRYINFAISNQFYLLAQHYGADFYNIYHALKADYPRMQPFARAGFAAGPCLVKDTMHLGANGGCFPLGAAALTINESLPEMVVRKLQQDCALADSVVGILGMAFKPECDDPRDSLSYKLRDLLQPVCRRVLCTDPFVPDPQLDPLDDVLREADLLIVGTPHACYRRLSYRQPVIDITDSLHGSDSSREPDRSSGGSRPRSARNGRSMPPRNGNGAHRKRA
jgi:UDP-N-acetyl-D-mannosaminuronic acid dehydrogenase